LRLLLWLLLWLLPLPRGLCSCCRCRWGEGGGGGGGWWW
jgi:hypothetical protein